jgi:hypothetical protein
MNLAERRSESHGLVIAFVVTAQRVQRRVQWSQFGVTVRVFVFVDRCDARVAFELASYVLFVLTLGVDRFNAELVVHFPLEHAVRSLQAPSFPGP